MTSCTRCGGTYDDDVRFCPRDGAPLGDLPDAYLGKILLGQFELLERIGAGAMGTVYRAWQNTMDRPVAVKVLRGELLRDAAVVKRFYREARAVARLSHPNIITVFLVAECDDGAPYIVMEMVEGPSLAQRLEADGRLEPGRAVRIATQIAAALAEAHAASVVHRDLKPENILLAPRRGQAEAVKVLDFGIAKLLASGTESHLTSTGALFGTPHYISPEQASGAEIDHRADLYSLGVILYRMLTGRLPFEGSTGMSVVLKHLHEVPMAPRELAPEMPPALEEVVLRAMAKDPAERFQTADDMAAALLSFDARRMTTRSMIAPEEPSRILRAARRPALWAPALALAIAGAGVVGWLHVSSRTVAAPVPQPHVELHEPQPAPPPASQAPHSLRLAEEGYAFDVAPPEKAKTGVLASFTIDADDPEGKPLAGAKLELGVRGPDRAQPEQQVAARERAPGRYVAQLMFAKPGSHHIHVYAQTKRGEKLKVWFDVTVDQGPATAVAVMHHNNRKKTDEEPLPGPPPAAPESEKKEEKVEETQAPVVAEEKPVAEPQPQESTPPPQEQPAPQPPAQQQPAVTQQQPPRQTVPPRYGPRPPWARWRRYPPPPPNVVPPQPLQPR